MDYWILLVPVSRALKTPIVQAAQCAILGDSSLLENMFVRFLKTMVYGGVQNKKIIFGTLKSIAAQEARTDSAKFIR